MGIEGPVKVTVEDAGPLVATLRIESDAPGCKKLIRRVRLCDGFDYVELMRKKSPESLTPGPDGKLVLNMIDCELRNSQFI